MNPAFSTIFAFLKESLQRLFTKSPKFFFIWSLISSILIVITGLPEVLGWFHIHLNDLWDKDVTIAVKWASRGMFIMSQLTSKAPVVGISDSGKILTSTDSVKLPFSCMEETKEIKGEVSTSTTTLPLPIFNQTNQ